MCELREQESDYFDRIVNKSLLGMTKIHNGLIVLEGCKAILRKDYKNMIGKVKLLSGGRTENELIHAGLVGPGMLTAAVLGNTFSAPSVNSILGVIEKIGSDHSSGILLIVQNYAEYLIIFTLAKLQAEAMGYNVRLITVNENNICNYFGDTIKEQDYLSILFIYKIAGAMSEEGKSIDEIESLCNSVANSGGLISLKTDCKNINYEEFQLEMLSNMANQLLKPMIDIMNKTSENKNESKIFCAGHEIAILIINFGCSQIQKNIFILELVEQIKAAGLKIRRIYVKDFMTYSNSKGFQICILNLSFSTVLIKYLDFPTFTSAWPNVLTSEMIGNENDETELITSAKYCKYDINLRGPIMNHEVGQAFLTVISMACAAIIACKKQLDKMDEQYGNGDYGSRLARGAKAIQDAIQKNEILGTNLCVTFTQISSITQKTVGGLQGGLYSLLFYNIAKAFSEYESDKEITADMWLNALITANKAIEQFKVLSIDDQTLLHTLLAVQMSLENALNQTMDALDAFGAAVKTAENFTTNVLYAQPPHTKRHKEFKYPNPQAHAVGIWMRAAYEGTKLKLIYRNTK
ncbi:unnamed protein product [Xylocopa violacea]|uniref:Triokinase/FMN cyclase n=1 Tax=Xylocopa violacea TaxID=135666 RepID=A0ABP1N481_XYLVO